MYVARIRTAQLTQSAARFASSSTIDVSAEPQGRIKASSKLRSIIAASAKASSPSDTGGQRRDGQQSDRRRNTQQGHNQLRSSQNYNNGSNKFQSRDSDRSSSSFRTQQDRRSAPLTSSEARTIYPKPSTGPRRGEAATDTAADADVDVQASGATSGTVSLDDPLPIAEDGAAEGGALDMSPEAKAARRRKMPKGKSQMALLEAKAEIASRRAPRDGSRTQFGATRREGEATYDRDGARAPRRTSTGTGKGGRIDRNRLDTSLVGSQSGARRGSSPATRSRPVTAAAAAASGILAPASGSDRPAPHVLPTLPTDWSDVLSAAAARPAFAGMLLRAGPAEREADVVVKGTQQGITSVLVPDTLSSTGTTTLAPCVIAPQMRHRAAVRALRIAPAPTISSSSSEVHAPVTTALVEQKAGNTALAESARSTKATWIAEHVAGDYSRHLLLPASASNNGKAESVVRVAAQALASNDSLSVSSKHFLKSGIEEKLKEMRL